VSAPAQSHTPAPGHDPSTAVSGAVLAGTGVALGAFGAHALKASLSADLLQVFETGVKYQMYHAVALLALSALPAYRDGWRRAPKLLLAGTLVFSLSLYVLALSGVKVLGAVTPIGGVLMLAGWVQVILDLRRRAP